MGQKVQLTDTAAHEFRKLKAMSRSEANHRRRVIRTPLDSESRNFWTEMAKNGTSWTILPIEQVLDRCGEPDP
jgi:hypothetical protein